ncbi:MAG: hypothetical protein OEY06_08960 [Gammaproteobacteria bacterium]|nr:hypothetical protein [Gammaproteobacteria bacterium]
MTDRNSNEFIGRYTRFALAKKTYSEIANTIASFDEEKRIQLKIAIFVFAILIAFFASSIFYIGCVKPWNHFVGYHHGSITGLHKDSCTNKKYFYMRTEINNDNVMVQLNCSSGHKTGDTVTIAEYKWNDNLTTYKEAETICLLKP